MKSRLLAAAIAAAALSACGGGGDYSSGSAAGGGSTSALTPASTTAISGTAATGAALANATVQAKCASGSGSATTAVDGTFSLKIDNAVRPCVLSVQTPDGTVLHSIVEAGSGTTAVANVTPLTELVTAAVAGGSTSDFFNTFGADAQAKLTPSGISDAVAAVRLSLAGTVDIAGMNPVTDTLVAANGNTPGNAQDQALDKLGAVLKDAGTNLADLSTAVAANPGSTNGPIQTILQKAAASCPSLRSGKYFRVRLGENQIDSATFDAATMKLAYASDGTVDTFVPHATDACRYTNADPARPFDLVVGKAGIGLVRDVSGSKAVGRVLVPAQQIPAEKRAGPWSGLSYGPSPSDPATMVPSRVYITFDAAGKVIAGSRCYSGMQCGAWGQADFPIITDGADGLSTTQSTGGPSFLITFMGTDGKMAMFTTKPGGFVLYTQAISLPLPAVGALTPFWDSVFDGTGAMSALTAYTNRIDSVDTATQTYIRTRLEDGRVDSWTNDKPTIGVRYRPQAPHASESYGIRVGGPTGLAAVISVNPAQNFYSLSVDRP